jgi:hypothetical protein
MYNHLIKAFYCIVAVSCLQITTAQPVDAPYSSSPPMRNIAGVSVIDTPIVRAAQSLARQHSADFAYNHVMRSWLFGALLLKHNATLSDSVDLEVHAVATLLHDLGWDQTPGSPFISLDRRFEVDGAFAARDFVRNNVHGKQWSDRRVQLVWDAIALHTIPSISNYKELEVMSTGRGILSDFQGPLGGVTAQEYAAVVTSFPATEMRNGMNSTIIWLCQTKPATTYGMTMPLSLDLPISIY